MSSAVPSVLPVSKPDRTGPPMIVAEGNHELRIDNHVDSYRIDSVRTIRFHCICALSETPRRMKTTCASMACRSKKHAGWLSIR